VTFSNIEGYHCCQLHSKFYQTFFCQHWLHTLMILGLIKVDSDITTQLLIMYAEWIKYLWAMGIQSVHLALPKEPSILNWIIVFLNQYTPSLPENRFGLCISVHAIYYSQAIHFPLQPHAVFQQLVDFFSQHPICKYSSSLYHQQTC
jgi:hypothetical protein